LAACPAAAQTYTTTGVDPDAASAALLAHWAVANYWIDAPRSGCLAGGNPADPCTRGRAAASAAADQDVAALRLRGWCHVLPRATNWYHCTSRPNEQQTVAQFSDADRRFYAQQFISGATPIVRKFVIPHEDPVAAYQRVRAILGSMLSACRDPVVEGLPCALTVAEREDLLPQIVNYHLALGPEYVLHPSGPR
jgi:hypothetical protein